MLNYDTTLLPVCIPPFHASARRPGGSSAAPSAAGAVGLSLAHIYTLPGCSFEFYAGGRLARLRSPQQPGPGYHGDRGIITGFSHASRIRCMQALAKINHRDMAHLPVLITLTYPGDWTMYDDERQWKAHLFAFRERLTRKYGQLGVCWKLEFQQRGAPHFHLLCYFGSAVGLSLKLKHWVSRAWYEVVGSGQAAHLAVGTNVKPIRSVRGVASYVSKYVAKVVDDVPMAVGRWWGIWNKAALPVTLLKVLITLAEFHKMRRCISGIRRSHGSKMALRSPHQGIWLFLDDGPSSDVLEWATG